MDIMFFPRATLNLAYRIPTVRSAWSIGVGGSLAMALPIILGHHTAMSNAQEFCPVCCFEAATFSFELGVTKIACSRCGTYAIVPGAHEDLLQSTAPIPTGYTLSSAFRWATILHSEVVINRERARRIIQRRRSHHTDTPADRKILFWLSRCRDDVRYAALPLDGWAAVVNDISPEQTLRRIMRLSHRGLITIEKESSEALLLALTYDGTELLSRQMERRRRRDRKTRSDREDLSVFSSVSNNYFYASKLYVSLYRCFGDEQMISFAGEDGRIARWTFLIGENGVGKTTVLQALAGLFPIKGNRRTRPSLNLETLSEGDTLFGRDIDDDSWIEAEFHKGGLGLEVVDPVILGAIGRHTSLDELEISLQLAADSVTLSWGNQFSYSANYDDLPRAPLIVGYGASRAVGRSSLTSDKDRSSAIHSLFYPETPLQDPEDWLLRNDYAARMRNTHQSVNRASNDKLSIALLDILPDVSAISILPPDDRHDRPYVGFQTSHGVVDYRSLSIGYQSTLAWIVDLAIRLIENYPDVENPLAMPVIVLIDEIDIHLHPTWQRSITEHLEKLFPSAQFIATTHSPLIIQGAVDANLVLLKAVNDQVIVVNDVDEIRNFRVDQILTSELFGLQSARPDDQAKLARRRVEILSSENPVAHAAELADLERELDTWRTTSPKSVSPSTLALLKELRS